jgi:hypothetical protein
VWPQLYANRNVKIETSLGKKEKDFVVLFVNGEKDTLKGPCD